MTERKLLSVVFLNQDRLMKAPIGLKYFTTSTTS